jgi:hypothetical protein
MAIFLPSSGFFEPLRLDGPKSQTARDRFRAHFSSFSVEAAALAVVGIRRQGIETANKAEAGILGAQKGEGSPVGAAHKNLPGVHNLKNPVRSA